MKARPIRTVLWGLPAMFMTYTNWRNFSTLDSMVTKLILNENGLTVDIQFASKRMLKDVDISCLSTLNREQLSDFFDETEQETLLVFSPVHLSNLVDQRIILVPKKQVHLENHLILNNVVKGNYIDLRG